jgi:hypothetical protein
MAGGYVRVVSGPAVIPLTGGATAQQGGRMARTDMAQRRLRGTALSSFGLSACRSGRLLEHEQRPGRRDPAKAARNPVNT